MPKRILTTVAIIIAIFFISYGLNNYVIGQALPFSLLSVYLFHAIATIIIYLIVETLNEKLPNQVGYAYLMLICFKIGAFVLIFQKSIFSLETLEMTSRISLVIPLFVFLITEGVIIGKLLTRK